jgi:hypothetical protein
MSSADHIIVGHNSQFLSKRSHNYFMQWLFVRILWSWVECICVILGIDSNGARPTCQELNVYPRHPFCNVPKDLVDLCNVPKDLVDPNSGLSVEA